MKKPKQSLSCIANDETSITENQLLFNLVSNNSNCRSVPGSTRIGHININLLCRAYRTIGWASWMLTAR